MNTRVANMRSLILLGGLTVGVAVAGCAHVTPEQMNDQLDQVRQEMKQGDQQNAQQIDQVSGRVDDLNSRVSSLEQDLKSLQSDFNTTVQQLQSALKFETPVHFAYDNADVRQQDHEYLDRFAAIVNKYYPDAIVTVEGFTDPAGSQDYNQRLGMRRATAVKDYLVNSANLSGDQIRTVSYGETTNRQVRPGAYGDDGLPNRRVVMVVDYTPHQGSGGSVAGNGVGTTQ